jgi:hypothetical protein
LRIYLVAAFFQNAIDEKRTPWPGIAGKRSFLLSNKPVPAIFSPKESLEEFSASYWGSRIGEFLKGDKPTWHGTSGAIGKL